MAAFVAMDGEVVTALAVPFGTSVLGSVFRFTVASTRGTSADIIPTLDTIHTALTLMADTHMVDITEATISTVEDRGNSGNVYRDRTWGDRDAALVARVQQRLARAGIYRGPIDGVLGDRTRYAIRVYERIHGLPADGRIDPRLLATMGIS